MQLTEAGYIQLQVQGHSAFANVWGLSVDILVSTLLKKRIESIYYAEDNWILLVVDLSHLRDCFIQLQIIDPELEFNHENASKFANQNFIGGIWGCMLIRVRCQSTWYTFLNTYRCKSRNKGSTDGTIDRTTELHIYRLSLCIEADEHYIYEENRFYHPKLPMQELSKHSHHEKKEETRTHITSKLIIKLEDKCSFQAAYSTVNNIDVQGKTVLAVDSGMSHLTPPLAQALGQY